MVVAWQKGCVSCARALKDSWRAAGLQWNLEEIGFISLATAQDRWTCQWEWRQAGQMSHGAARDGCSRLASLGSSSEFFYPHRPLHCFVLCLVPPDIAQWCHPQVYWAAKSTGQLTEGLKLPLLKRLLWQLSRALLRGNFSWGGVVFPICCVWKIVFMGGMGREGWWMRSKVTGCSVPLPASASLA